MKVQLPLAEGRATANKLLGAILSTRRVTRGEILGSIRRGKPAIGDIELLLEPARDFTGEAALGPVLESTGIRRAPPHHERKRPWSTRYYCGVAPIRGPALGPEDQIQVDVFVCLPPAQWGLLKLIRTGDAQFSHAFVSRLHRFGLMSHKGEIIRPGGVDGHSLEFARVPCATEDDCFRAARLPYIEPNRRDWTLEETRKTVMRL